MLQLLYLDVSKVDRVLHLFAALPTHLVTRAVRAPHGARNGVQRTNVRPDASTTAKEKNQYLFVTR
jgi:hypothetical protein